MAPTQEHQCKGCGLLVQPGYPRCPRCTMPLPGNRGKKNTISGGTAVEEESQNSLWIGLAALAVVGLLVLYFASGDKSTTGTSTDTDEDNRAPAASPSAVAPAAANGPRPPQNDSPVGISLDEAPPTADELRERAVSALRQALTDQRLWSTVSIEEGSVLTVVSGACEDENMKPTINRSAAALAGVGLRSVRCLEKHGAQVFEQGL